MNDLTNQTNKLPEVQVRSKFCFTHSFPFANSFPVGTPLREIVTRWGKLSIGDCSKGLCGGFIFAALDFCLLGRPIPQRCDVPIRDYLIERLFDSFNGVSGIYRIWDWMSTPPDKKSTTLLGIRCFDSVQKLTVEDEWPKVMHQLHNHANPVPLMLIRAASEDPCDLGKNHQVLATGYDYYPTTGRVVLHVYDPNYPPMGSNVPVTLTFSSREGEYECKEMNHSIDGSSIRGFYVNEYTHKEPPAMPI
jgi:hypothetical protein